MRKYDGKDYAFDMAAGHTRIKADKSYDKSG
jgi:hypothetical protein